MSNGALDLVTAFVDFGFSPVGCFRLGFAAGFVSSESVFLLVGCFRLELVAAGFISSESDFLCFFGFFLGLSVSLSWLLLGGGFRATFSTCG